MTSARVLGALLLLLLSSCVPAWTRAEVAAAQLVSATEQLVDAALVQSCRVDVAEIAATNARALAALLAHPWPSREDIQARTTVLDASLLSLTSCPGLRPSVRDASAALLLLRQEIARRRHGPFGRPLRIGS
jgi:hypothetical protein